MRQLIAPLTFLIMFVVFIYGALFLAVLGIANWLLHIINNAYILSFGFKSAVITALILLFLWILVNFIISKIVFYVLLKFSNERKAYKISNVVLMALFHIFIMPVLFWEMIRQRSKSLRKRRRDHLRKIVRGKNKIS